LTEHDALAKMKTKDIMDVLGPLIESKTDDGSKLPSVVVKGVVDRLKVGERMWLFLCLRFLFCEASTSDLIRWPIPSETTVIFILVLLHHSLYTGFSQSAANEDEEKG
jgi:hypothetical protein